MRGIFIFILFVQLIDMFQHLVNNKPVNHEKTISPLRFNFSFHLLYF